MMWALGRQRGSSKFVITIIAHVLGVELAIGMDTIRGVSDRLWNSLGTAFDRVVSIFVLPDGSGSQLLKYQLLSCC